MSRGTMECDTSKDIQVRIIKDFLVRFVQRHVVPQIHIKISFCGNGPTGMLGFLFMNVDQKYQC